MTKLNKPKFKGFAYEDESKPLITTAYFDGYGFGDRLLEGVIFKAEIANEGASMVVTFLNPDGEYEKGLNQNKWLAEAAQYAQDCPDCFCDTPNLHGEDVTLITADPPKPAPKPFTVPIHRAADLFKPKDTVESVGNELYDILEKELKNVLPAEQFERVCKQIIATSMKFQKIGQQNAMQATTQVIKEQLFNRR